MICDVLGRALPDLSEDSVEKSCIPPILNNGRMASAITMIPNPPYQCNIPRHNKIPRGFSARFEMTVAPNVVNPDIDSKNASV